MNMTMNTSVLIFPAGMPLALDFLKRSLREQRKVIGASSMAHDPVRNEYPAWLTLPYINHDGFDDALARAIRDFDVGGIYTPHPVVWDYLNLALRRIAPTVSLLNASPANTELEVYRTAQNRAQKLLDKPLPLGGIQISKPDLTLVQIATLYRHVEDIPGMCDHEKIRALYEVARCCPAGDVVEIGTWWGKSAFVLLRLSQGFGIGNLLCVDPWSDAGIISDDAHELVASTFAKFSAEEAFCVFLVNLLPYGNGNINYLRMPSISGANHYREHGDAETPAFGKTNYTGHIALLHIDGNHSYENARADVAAWGDLVMPGGWIVIDDYTWPFGDGPKRVGNEYLVANRERISTAFVMGGALFMRLI